jgi:hypothetical protein
MHAQARARGTWRGCLFVEKQATFDGIIVAFVSYVFM